MDTNTQVKRIVYSNDEFAERGLWRDPIVPYFDSRKRLRVLSPFGLFAVMALAVTVMGAAFAFAV